MDELVMSGWSVASPFGLGVDPFAAGIGAGRRPVSTPVSGPFDEACVIPGFDIPAVLGPKGTRAMDRATGIAVAGVGMLLEQYGAGLTDRPESVGLVLGTGSGSVQSIIDFTRESMTGDKPYHVDPARFPNTVMNRAAGQSAIWHGLKGPNATVAGGAATGLLALNYATRLLRRGRCETILCGAVEEFSEHRGRLAWQAGHRDEPLGEGCAIFLMETGRSAARAGRTPLATVLGSRFAAFTELEEAGPCLAGCVTGLLERLWLDPGDVRLVAASGTRGGLGEQEELGISESVGTGAARLRCRDVLGDMAAASAAFQVAAVLAAGGPRASGARPGDIALVTTMDRDGVTGCTVLRLEAGARAERAA
ncbi:3-oxoacyl-ACP synthase [Nonomuraea sp. FMUSA5-5]|uniref:3-oxoacyl-ACP synthase n=1 Tax=Nonomuraea composti TaxID=2720023 RepID=A0ABX1BMK6_9ACTN|nr:beta-ketoacyl synthase N-terminal-like domain-containing protein [Nonomuraea sp. FMUSA5-5]NJP96348.1 3-oxoacyl-ACP synthase [Nonomuraea sp. FMUSA5-5]